MRRRNQTAIALAAADANKATADANKANRRMLNKAKETQRRNRNETKLPPQTRISNSSKPCVTVKNFAPSCCNNSTPSWQLAILPAVLL